jgi:Yip1-like protein
MATTSTPMPEMQAQPQAAIGPFGRVIGVFFSPGRTFEDIVRKPGWVLPVVLSTVLGILVSVAINQRINWRDFMNQQIEKSPRAAQLSSEQKQQQIEGGAKFAPISTYVFGTLGPVLAALIVGLVMWGAYSLLGGISTNFGTAFSITAHAFLTGLVSSPLFILILYLKPYGTADLDNPVAANVAAILPDESAKWLVALCKSIDIFLFWTLILLAIGFAAVNPKKLKGAKSFTIAFSVWAVYVVCRVGWAFIFS